MKIRQFLNEKLDMDWLADNVIGKIYKNRKIVNAVYDDKKGEMIRFWVEDKGKKPIEVRPIPKDELVKVLR